MSWVPGLQSEGCPPVNVERWLRQVGDCTCAGQLWRCLTSLCRAAKPQNPPPGEEHSCVLSVVFVLSHARKGQNWWLDQRLLDMGECIFLEASVSSHRKGPRSKHMRWRDKRVDVNSPELSSWAFWTRLDLAWEEGWEGISHYSHWSTIWQGRCWDKSGDTPVFSRIWAGLGQP